MNANLSTLSRARDAVFGRTFELSLVKSYVSRWGMAQAVRELMQNALDSSSPFVYEFVDEGDAGFALRLNSEFAILTTQSLLLGATSKRDDEDAIGSFGEGYKIALLVLTREGYDVAVHNGDVVWRPHFRFSRTFGDEILCIDETPAPDRSNRGVTFVVHGLSAADVEQIRASCLAMQENVGEVKRTEVGDILLDQPGRLYVGGLFICETELKHGYNIKPKFLRLERDRQTVSSFDLKWIAKDAWFSTGETDRIATMIADDVPDLEYAEHDAPELVKDACYRIFRERHPGAIAAKSQDELEAKIRAGFERVVVVRGAMYGAVTSSKAYRSAAPRVAVVAPHVALAAYLAAHRDEMRTKAIVAFKLLIKEAAEKWTNK